MLENPECGGGTSGIWGAGTKRKGSLIFFSVPFGKKGGKTTTKARIFILAEPLKNPWKRRAKRSKRQGLPWKEKNARKSKKTRKRRSGLLDEAMRLAEAQFVRHAPVRGVTSYALKHSKIQSRRDAPKLAIVEALWAQYEPARLVDVQRVTWSSVIPKPQLGDIPLLGSYKHGRSSGRPKSVNCHLHLFKRSEGRAFHHYTFNFCRLLIVIATDHRHFDRKNSCTKSFCWCPIAMWSRSQISGFSGRADQAPSI